ncbi:hypothetical protein [Desulfotalea psychrophila]|uniref:Uncharacterized protein n=1 Tax=Desulfotalea psychrophila (strain LSv54 / DSM 12343) TaxID=177439 RepID=Q6ANX9_DESPS|nr:hypothetical protein [Desulfotalea psychrophila]CAG35945.1 unknown protein [Desulfotalea psychrophila LSv54]
MTTKKKAVRAVAAAMLATMLTLLTFTVASANSEPIRIVVLPFYVEAGDDANDGGSSTLHYRRMMRFINNQLVRHNFEVVNPFAGDASEREYNRVMERSHEDSALASLEVCRKYATDAAYISWLKVKVRKTSDGYCKASARLDGEGYDSAGHDLGVGMSKTFKVTRRDCDDAIAEVEKEVGDLVGRKLTAWNGHRSNRRVVRPAVHTAPATGGALARNFKQHEQYLSIKLDGVTEYAIVEVFGKVLKTANGVNYAKNYGQRIVPDNPQASYVSWRVNISGTDPFVLQANIMKMLNDISANGGEIVMKGVPYRYTQAEIDMLKGVRPGDATSREVQFVLDRELVRDLEMSGTFE